MSGCFHCVCAAESPLFFPSIESLSDNATAFSNRAKQLRRQMWWRGCKVSKSWKRQGWVCGGVVTCPPLGGMEKLCFLAEKILEAKGLLLGRSSYM